METSGTLPEVADFRLMTDGGKEIVLTGFANNEYTFFRGH